MNDPVISREEGDFIPLGVSCTETEKSYFIRIKESIDSVVTIRYTKNTFPPDIHVSADKKVAFDPKNWHGVYGTNG